MTCPPCGATRSAETEAGEGLSRRGLRVMPNLKSLRLSHPLRSNHALIMPKLAQFRPLRHFRPLEPELLDESVR